MNYGRSMRPTSVPPAMITQKNKPNTVLGEGQIVCKVGKKI
jgi:hypothetical protein